MPELIEVEQYRRAAEVVVGRRILEIPVLDPRYPRPLAPGVIVGSMVDERVLGVGRRGKLMWLDTSGPRLGLRFGMTGRIVVDGEAPIDRLEYGGLRDDRQWDRLVMRFDRGTLVIRDPRRFGAVELDPDLSRLGPDAATLSTAELRLALGRSRAPVKARLLDQGRVAGLGNLLVDETLWRVGIAPDRPAGSLDTAEQRRLARGIRHTVALLTRRGGSHTGDLHVARVPGAACPRDGSPLRTGQVGGRTTYWCPTHQR